MKRCSRSKPGRSNPGISVRPRHKDSSAASNGFPGFNDQIAGSWSRTNYALYGAAEWRVIDPRQVDLAVRWEDFEDFGTTTNGKVATNYRFNDAFAIRGSWSTGFRAPTPRPVECVERNDTVRSRGTGAGQSRHDPIDQSGGGTPRRRGAGARGIAESQLRAIPLLGSFTLTADYYIIEVDDRIAVSQDPEPHAGGGCGAGCFRCQRARRTCRRFVSSPMTLIPRPKVSIWWRRTTQRCSVASRA